MKSKQQLKFDKSKLNDVNGMKYIFELWHLEKVDNKAEHSMIECDGKIWYWCDKHKYNNKGVITNGMNVTHKPDDHDNWVAKGKKKTTEFEAKFGRKGFSLS